MKTIFIADDGTQFDDFDKCEEYETIQKHQKMFDIIFADENGTEYTLNKDDPFNDLTYHKAWKVVIKTQEELDELAFLASECGWIKFEQITDLGTWIRFEGEDFDGVWKNAFGVWMKVIDVTNVPIVIDILDEDLTKEEMRQRAISTAKSLWNMGFKAHEISQIIGKSRSTVRRWLKEELEDK